ncbi:GatB/YqeY domain-containing protein [Candidatus Parcubacteria bacterium]|nr:GatB/YqeY domain-containing protein [Candidatus Parcubacteria bacterium]
MLINQVMEDLKTAMREKNKEELGLLRMLSASFKNKKIDLGNKDELTEEQAEGVVKSEVKKRKDSIKAYEEGNREDLVKIEKVELAILEKYLPKQMSDEDLEEIVKDVINSMGNVTMKEFGKIMGQIMGKVKGLADGDRVTTMVKKILNG